VRRKGSEDLRLGMSVGTAKSWSRRVLLEQLKSHFQPFPVRLFIAITRHLDDLSVHPLDAQFQDWSVVEFQQALANVDPGRPSTLFDSNAAALQDTGDD
jgi:hypothetical protein